MKTDFRQGVEWVDDFNHEHAIRIIRNSIKDSYKYSAPYIAMAIANETIFTCSLLGVISQYEVDKWERINNKMYNKKMAK